MAYYVSLWVFLYMNEDLTHNGIIFSFLAITAMSNEPKGFLEGSFGWRWKLEPSQASQEIISSTKPNYVAPLAILAISSFVLTLLPGNPRYYQSVMGIIGKVYANSMMVLINSRIHLGVEGEQTTVVNLLSDINFEPRCVDSEGTSNADREPSCTSWWDTWIHSMHKYVLNSWASETRC